MGNQILTPARIELRVDAIIAYWECLYSFYPHRFSREINLALTGTLELSSDWRDVALGRLVEVRGFEGWGE